MRYFLLALGCVAVLLPASHSQARKVTENIPRFTEAPRPADLPPDLLPYKPALTVADTFHLAWYNFNLFDTEGWSVVDPTAQRGTYFHVADATELDGGSSGELNPLEGSQSAWCGTVNTGAADVCTYATLPGYGNTWEQGLRSKVFAGCDSISMGYKIQWDTEPNYDRVVVQWREDGAEEWTNFANVNGGAGDYDDRGSIYDAVGVAAPGDIELRFWFVSDGAFSDEDGNYDTDGAVLVDSITVLWYNEVPPDSDNWVLSGSYYEDFEDEAPGATMTTDGCWTADQAPGFGEFGELYVGLRVLQEDICLQNNSAIWGLFDDPLITNYLCHTPDPVITQGAMRYGPDESGLYMNNELWSPEIPVAGAGNQWIVSFRVYRDMPLDNLQFYYAGLRSLANGCPLAPAAQTLMMSGGDRAWLQQNVDFGASVSPAATDVQIILGAIDGCGFWCNVFGTGNCHSHAPLFDDVHLLRINTTGPQLQVQHFNLFQDNFAADGTTSGKARADMASDIARLGSPTILPGDSIVFSAQGVGGDDVTGVGPSAYVYVAVWPPNQAGKTPADMEAPEVRAGVGGKRFPFVDTTIRDGVTWARFRADSAVTNLGAPVADTWCFDLNDAVFTPGDTICYVLCVEDAIGQSRYFSRRLDGQGEDFLTDQLGLALDSPMEFTILPAGGWRRGGNILYVDDADDRGGPVQLYFDTSFEAVGLADRIDRFDVLAPSSIVNNSLASRVTNPANQILSRYRNILWCSGDLSSGLLGDGSGNPEKSDDYTLVFDFLEEGLDNPGLYLSGDNIAEEWVTLTGAGAINLRSIYMTFNLIDGDHVRQGEAISPVLTATGACFTNPSAQTLIAYGGCPIVNDFDVLEPVGDATTEFPYPGGSGAAVISQIRGNSVGTTARAILSGFSFDRIRDQTPVYPPNRFVHMQSILIWLINSATIGTGVPDIASRDFLAHAAPNPFNPATSIRYGVRERGHVSLKVYNVAGQLVRTLVDDLQAPSPDGRQVTWDGRNDAGMQVSSGVYFYRLTAPGFTETRKMVLLK